MSSPPQTTRWTHRALRTASRLDRPTRERIVNAVERLARTGYGDVKKLKGRDGTYRLRVGPWRIFFSKEADDVLVIRAIRPRGDAY